MGEIQKVLGNLLREGVAIRDLVTILEALSDAARVTKVPELLTEYVRQSMGRQIVAPYLVDYKLFVLTLDPELDQVIKDGIQQTEQGSFLALEPQTTQKLLSRLVDWTGRVMNAGHQPVVLCSPVVRFHLKRLTEKMIPNLIVLSYNEILPDINVESLGMVSIDEN